MIICFTLYITHQCVNITKTSFIKKYFFQILLILLIIIRMKKNQ